MSPGSVSAGMPAVAAVAEENDAGVILFALEYPGACGWGPTEADARERLRAALRDTLDWLDDHGLARTAPRPDPAVAPIEVTERVPATGEPRQCDSEGCFAFDRRAYSDAEVRRTRALLRASRRDLLDLVAGLEARTLDRRLVADRRTVREVLDHVAVAEHWYLTRVEVPVDVPDGWDGYPDETFERLAETRADVVRALRSLPDVPRARRTRSWVVDGERWSLRKLLRRLVWHERLHARQLERLVPKVEARAGHGDDVGDRGDARPQG